MGEMIEISKDRLERAAGTISVEIKDMCPGVNIQVNDSVTILIAINAMLTAVQKYFELDKKQALDLAAYFYMMSETASFESKEQARVVREILKKTRDE